MAIVFMIAPNRKVLSPSDVRMGRLRVTWGIKEMLPKSDDISGSRPITIRVGDEDYTVLWRNDGNFITRMAKVLKKNYVHAGDTIEFNVLLPDKKYLVRFFPKEETSC